MDERHEEWVHAHRVCFEIDRLPQPRGDQGHPALGLTLLARCLTECGMDPAGPASLAVHEQLARIAAEAIPAGLVRHFEPHDASLHLRPESAFHPEVELVVEVLASGRDPEAVREAIEDALLARGVQPHAWSEEIRLQAGRVRKSASQLGIVPV